MKIVTGGLGVIGMELCKRLLETDDVCVIDSLVGCTSENKNILLHGSGHGHELLILDEDISNISDLDMDFDKVFNLACPSYSNVYLQDPIYTLRTCTTGILNIIRLCRKHNAKMIQVSGAEVYGSSNINPIHENYPGYATCTGLHSCYIEGKRCSETILINSDIQFNIARVFNTYGKHYSENDNRVIPTFIRNAKNNSPLVIHGTGKHTRTYTYVGDTVDGILLLANSDYKLPVNIGNPYTEISTIQLATLIKQLTASRSSIIFTNDEITESLWCRPDISIAKTILNWEPKIDLHDGLKLIL